MIFIIEGPDRVGKDTLINNLKLHFSDKQVGIFHSNKPPHSDPILNKEWSTTLYTNQIKLMNQLDTQELSNNIYIFNRSYLGENVYAPLYRNYDGSYVFELEKQLTAKPILITLVDTADNLLRRDDKKGYSKVVEDINIELNKFTTTFNNSIIKNKHYIAVDTFKSSMELFQYVLTLI